MGNYTEKQISILQVAEKLFAENGFDGTSIRDISKKAGVNIAMVSYYFGSKEKLLEGIIIHRAENLKFHMENLFKEDLGPLEKIEKLIDLYLSLVHQNRCIYQIMNSEVTNKKRLIDTQAFMDAKRNNFNILQKIIEEGQAKNIFRKDINAYMIPPTIMGTYFHFVNSKTFFMKLIDLPTEEDFENYVAHDVKDHIKKIIKSTILA